MPPDHPSPIRSLRDEFGARVDHLRVSLTDACILRCVYCMPDTLGFKPRSRLLTDEQLLRLLRLFSEVGVRKIRFTGSEPTLRSSLLEIVRETVGLPGIEDVGLTTNGSQLAELAQPLREAGLSSVNVSIDSLVPDLFGRNSRCGRLADVLEGVRAASSAGLRIKINCVVCRGFNDGNDVVDLARLTEANDWQVRFSEEMPSAKGARKGSIQPIARTETVAKLEAHFGPLQPVKGPSAGGHVSLYRIPGARGTIGFVSPVSDPFSDSCNRIRLTAEGNLRLCLMRDEEVQLRMMLHNGASDEDLKSVICRAIRLLPWSPAHAQRAVARPRKIAPKSS